MQKASIYQKLANNYREELLESLTAFVAIDSVYDESSVDEKNPFGKGVTNALQYIAELAKKDGFKVVNYDNYVVEIIAGEGDKNITIMAHADVVPVGTGWHQDPFTITERKGVLSARGVADDKGPLLSAYYALKMLRDNHLLGDYQVRFLVGGNEERGSKCMHHYFQDLKMPQPTLGFSPDSDFPLIYGEKGIINFKVKKSLDINGVFYIHGGVASNSVIERCVVRMRENQFFLKKLQSEGIDFQINFVDEGMEVAFIGKAAHGAEPEEGLNAGMIAIKALGEFLEDDNLKILADRFLDLKGAGLKAANESESMGHNTLNVGLLDYENNELSIVVNFRHVDGVNETELIETIKTNAQPFDVEIISISPLLFFPLDSTLISTLLSAYQEETGDLVSKPLTTGGGTYAKEADNIVAFGMQFSGWDSMMHSPGEKVKKDDLFKSMAIYARAIVELGKKLNEN